MNTNNEFNIMYIMALYREAVVGSREAVSMALDEL